MNKALFFIVALLVPSLACAGGPSIDLSAQKSAGGGVACDIGPTYSGPVPAEASQAGLTTCAANYDFTTSAYSNLSSWLDCTQYGTGTGQWHIGVAGFPSWGGCNAFSMVADSIIGKQVLQIEYPSGTNSIESMSTQGNEGTGTIELGLPYTYYIETVYRMVGLCGNCAQNQGGPNGLFVWSNNWHNLEDDLGELYVDTGGFGDKGWINWAAGACGSGNCIIPASYKGDYPPSWGGVTAYTKYGSLVTSNGTNAYWCTYLNDTLIDGKCFTPPGGPNTNSLQNNVNVLILQTQGNNNPQNYDLRVQYIRVFSCPSYKTGRCYGTTVTSGPKSETFYHQ